MCNGQIVDEKFLNPKINRSDLFMGSKLVKINDPKK